MFIFVGLKRTRGNKPTIYISLGYIRETFGVKYGHCYVATCRGECKLAFGNIMIYNI